jgi:hypothetical protein
MFKRKKLEVYEEAFPSEADPAAPSAPEEPDLRTTCYPQDTSAPPAGAHSRTTVYRQSLAWNRRGYDTIN